MRVPRRSRVPVKTITRRFPVLACTFAALFGAAAATSTGTAAQVAAAQTAGKTAADGVYSDEQRRAGQQLSQASCVSCHGQGLAGSDLAPPLFGPDFIGAWSGRSVGDLYEKIHTTMPADGIGTLKPQQTADLIAYILNLNDFPAGAGALPPERATLNDIKIRKK